MFSFKPWRPFRAYHDKTAIRAFLRDAADTTKDTFRANIRNGPKSGRSYGAHIASAPGEFPATDTGRLMRSVRTKVSSYDAEVGSTVFYGAYLADGTKNEDGTRKMAKRKMSKEAMQEALPEVRARLRHWATWRRG